MKRVISDRVSFVFTCVVLLLAAFLIVESFARAQVPSAPKLSVTETVAFSAIAGKQRDNRAEAASLNDTVLKLEAEIAKEHPGYHFDEPTGAIVRDAAKAPEKKAAPAEPAVPKPAPAPEDPHE